MYHYEVATGDALWGKNSDQVIEDFTTYANTTEGDASWVTDNTSKMRVNPTTDVFDFSNSASTQDITAYYDIGTANISDTAWVCRFKWDFTTYTPSTVAAQVTLFNVGLTSLHEGGWNATEDYLQIEIISVGSTNEMRLVANNNGTVINNAMDITPSATTYYVELTRTSATNFRIKIFSDSNYTTQLGSTSDKTITSAYTGLRYFTMHMKVESTNGNQIGTIDDIEFWNGVTTATTGNAWSEEGT